MNVRPVINQAFSECEEHHAKINSSPPGQNASHFADDILKRTFVKENVKISIIISLKFAPMGSVDNKSSFS